MAIDFAANLLNSEATEALEYIGRQIVAKMPRGLTRDALLRDLVFRLVKKDDYKVALTLIPEFENSEAASQLETGIRQVLERRREMAV